MTVKPFRRDNLSPAYILGHTLEHVENIDCVAVITIDKAGNHGVSLSSVAGKDLCYMKCAMDDKVAEIFESARQYKEMTLRPMTEEELERDRRARENAYPDTCEVHGVGDCQSCGKPPGAA